MNDFTTPAAGNPAPQGGASDIGALIKQASDTSLPMSGRNKILEQIDAYHRNNPQGPASDTPADAPAEGLEGPSSPLAYTLEQALPPGVEVVDQPGLGALKGNLHALGVPPEIASGVFTEIATLHSAGVFQSDAAYDQQIAMCKSAIAKVHGEGAKAVLHDAAAYIDKAVAAGKLTPDQVDAICASPLAVRSC